MSVPTEPHQSSGGQVVRPVAGPIFRHVAQMDVEGAKRRKLLALVAAFQDGGARNVAIGRLAEHLGWHYLKVNALADRLEADGYIRSKRKGGRRRVRLADDIAGGAS